MLEGERTRALADRLRLGVGRVRGAWWPIMWAAVCAGVAYAVAGAVNDHQFPFFAAVAAWTALGFSPDIQPRRTAEVAIGVAIGVGLGEVFSHLFGPGPVQTVVVVTIAACLALLLDGGPLVTSQSTVQAIVVTGLPAIALEAGPFGRWQDAAVGGLVAFLFAVGVPKDPRRRPRRLGSATLNELAAVLDLTARGLRTGEVAFADEALERGRATQGQIDAWASSVTSARGASRVSPAWRRHRAELETLAATAELTDRAMRNARVLARRSGVAIRHGAAAHVAGSIAEAGLGVRRISAVVADGGDTTVIEADLRALASRLTAPDNPDVADLTALLRSLVMDLLQIVGESADQARAAFDT